MQPCGMNELILPVIESSNAYGQTKEERRECTRNPVSGPLTKTATQCKEMREKDRVERSRRSKVQEQTTSRELENAQKSAEPANGQEQKLVPDAARRGEEESAKHDGRLGNGAASYKGTKGTVAEKMDTEETNGNDNQNEVDEHMREEREQRALQDYQMQLMLLDAQNKTRRARALQKEEVEKTPTEDPPQIVDYNNQLRILEARNRLRLTLARYEGELPQYREAIGAKVKEIDTLGLDTNKLVTLLKMLEQRCRREVGVREAHEKKRESVSAYQNWLLLLEGHNMKTKAENEQMEGLKKQMDLQTQTEKLVPKSPEMQKVRTVGCGGSQARRLWLLRKKKESEEAARIEAAEQAEKCESDLERKVW